MHISPYFSFAIRIDKYELIKNGNQIDDYGKLFNFGDDIASDAISKKQVSAKKSITSGAEISAEFKGKDTFYFVPYCTSIFGANSIPYIADNESGAGTRRLIIITFKQSLIIARKIYH